MNDPPKHVEEPELQTLPPSPAEDVPPHIGRYRVEKVLGRGGFGIVYLAYDDELQRLVAIKVPHHHLVSRLEDAQAYLTEARTIAGLDHPNIVPVYDMGRNEEHPVFIVSKFIEGTTLAQRIAANRPSLAESVGRAFGKLPEKSEETSKEQRDFLKQAVSGLSQENKVICVRLALFAEMMKGRTWDPATLKQVGGAEGVGVAFLEDTFSASTANPKHRLHQKAARAVLKSLLPETGTEIKGHMRSQQVLIEASGYANRPKEFEDLLRILDGELRLLTPTDPEGQEEQLVSRDAERSADMVSRDAERSADVVSRDAERSADVVSRDAQRSASAKYYQLTHDYLVPSLREWLTRKQKETRRGRAELLLADRAAVWNARPENRQLPSLLQWLQVRWLTQKKNWTRPQRKMMRRATRFHLLRAVTLGVLLTVAGWGVYEGHGRLQAHALRERLLDANINDVPAIVQDMAPYRRWLDPLLHDAHAQAESAKDRRKQLHSALALLPVDAAKASYLTDRLLDAEAGEVAVLSDALLPHKDQFLEKLWTIVEAPDKGKEAQRLRAAAALAKYDPESQKWAKCSALVVGDLVRESPVFLLYWSEAYRPVKDALLEPLGRIFRDPRPERGAERSLATNLLADYAADNPRVLADLLMDADDKQFAVIFPALKEQGERALPILAGEIDKKLPPNLPSSDEKREKLAKRQANAAVALLRMSQTDKVWPLLKHSPDPRVRSYLIHRLSPLGADAGAIIKRLEEEADLSIHRALLLSLGEFGEKELRLMERQALLPKVQDIYRTDPDPGLHAAAEWLLRQCKEKAWLQQVNEEWANDKQQRQKRLQGIQQLLTKDKDKTPPQWYVNGQGQTMVVIPGPVEFLMGSPATEEGWSPVETQHKRRIGRTFAVAAKSVTVEEFRRFMEANRLEAWFEAGGQAAPLMKKYSPEEDGPIIIVDWFRAAVYCNWLSEQEGIPPEQWCYETNAQSLAQESVSAGVSMLTQRHPLAAAGASSYFLLERTPQVTGLRKNYLRRTGYRLPTEAEMEYATRAGALTSRYYGETEELLPKYAWYLKNSQEKTWPVGSLKPNDFGLFDTHGNVHTWCQETCSNDPQSKDKEIIEDKEDILIINTQNSRVLRGGSFFYLASFVRSSFRSSYVPSSRFSYLGFRPV